MNVLHWKIYTAKKLLLKQDVVGKDKFICSGEDFCISESLLSIVKDNLILLTDCLLSKEYIDYYRKKRAEFELQEHRRALASIGGGGYNYKETLGWKSYLTDEYCGLGEIIYNNLLQENKIKVNVLDFEKTLKWQISPLSYISFDIEIYPKKIQEFLNRNISLFIKDELELIDNKTQRQLSYEKQKESFSIAIVNQLNQGYSPNNLKIDYTQIYPKKEFLLQTSFLETALGMEKEELIEIKDIIEHERKDVVVISSDDVWKYPTIIQLKTLPNFSSYYERVYKKYTANTINEQSKKSEQTPNDEKTPLLTAVDKKLRILEKLEGEENLTPKISVKRHISFGYSYIRPANEASLSEQKLTAWIKECGLSDVNELENILSIFQQNGLISKFNFSEQNGVLKIQFPEDFEKRSNEYKKRILGTRKPAELEVAGISETEQQDKKPYCVIEGKCGFIKFSKQGEKIKIGNASSQPFKLLQCLTEPLETAKAVDTVFEAIREGIKHKSRIGIYTIGIDKPQKIKLIEYVIKELQKGNKLQGKLEFKWNDPKTNVRLEYVG